MLSTGGKKNYNTSTSINKYPETLIGKMRARATTNVGTTQCGNQVCASMKAIQRKIFISENKNKH